MSVNKLFLKPNLTDYIYNILNIDQNNLDERAQQKIFDYLINLSGEVYRQVKSRKTIKVYLDKNYFIKTHQPLSLKEVIKNLLSFKWPVSNALDEQRAISAVQKLKINTLELAGFGEFNNYSFLITEAIEPNLSLDKLLESKLNTPDYFKLKRILIKFIAETTRLLHDNGLNHRDYYACHYLLKLSQEQDTENPDLAVNFVEHLYLIDLHRMQIRCKTPTRYIIKDLSGLLFSIRNYNFTKTDYLRFVKYYSRDNGNNSNNSISIDYRNYISFWKKVATKAKKLREKG